MKCWTRIAETGPNQELSSLSSSCGIDEGGPEDIAREPAEDSGQVPSGLARAVPDVTSPDALLNSAFDATVAIDDEGAITNDDILPGTGKDQR